MVKARELRNMSVDELLERQRDINRELYQLRNDRAVTKKPEGVADLRRRKRDRARVLTVLTEKQSANKQTVR